MARERIPTDQPVRHLWARFGVLESVSGARQFLTRREADAGVSLDDGLIEAKAQGLAFAVRSAREYFGVPIEGNLTNACLAFYYGMLSLLQALLLGEVENSLALTDMERFTNKGHGLRALHVPEAPFPTSERVMILRDGFLPRYLRAHEYPVEIDAIAVERGYGNLNEVPEAETDKIVPISGLIGRIPELLSVYVQLFDEPPQYLGIQIVGPLNAARIHFPYAGNAPGLTPERIREMLSWPSTIAFTEDESSLRTNDPQDIASTLSTRTRHSTVLAYDSYVAPLMGIDDVFVIEFMLLYVLSIWVRYRPALWREINEGALDQFRALVTNLLIAVERTAPNMALDRLYGHDFLFAPFSYYS
jgi:hypothetical protein